MTAPLLRAKGVGHSYGTHVVLEDVSFALKAGQCLALVGPNGAGKSTLLRCLVGHQRPSRGEFWLDGEQIDEISPRFRRDVASVLDDLDFFPDLTVLEHLDLLARAHGVEDADEVVDAVLGELGVQGAADQFPATLSSGQRRRVALATALVRPHRLLVLDEPEQRLDADGRSWLQNRLRAAREAGVAVVIASHDSELVAAIGSRTLELGT